MSTYPDWVLAQKKKGQAVKKVGSRYYLYNRTSTYVPGKNPKTVDTYVGIITEDGVIPAKSRKVASSGVNVREYGYSTAVFKSAPESWKKITGDDWENILKQMIVRKSPNSIYAQDDLGEKRPSKALTSYETSLRHQLGFSISEFEPLLYVYQVESGSGKVISNINKEQKEILERHGIEL